MDYEDYPDEEWVEDDGEEEFDLLACPSCREDVHEDTQQCPHCGEWITPVDTRSSWKNTVWSIAVIFVILSFLIVTIF